AADVEADRALLDPVPVAARGSDPAEAAPHVGLGLLRPRGFEVLEDPEAADDRMAARLEDVRTHPLVGGGVAVALDQGDAGPLAPEEGRGRATGDACAHDRNVVSPISHRPGAQPTRPRLGASMTLITKLGSSIVAADDGELREDVLD